MATKVTELYGSESFARVDGMHIVDKHNVKFATGSGTLPKGTAVARNTVNDNWVQWVNNGTNGTGTIRGFAAEDITLDATDNVYGYVMFKGEVNFSDIVIAGGTEAQLKVALLEGDPNLRENNIIVTGLEGAY